MGITERKIRQKENVRCAILDAAWRMVETDGWQSLSIRKIAEAIEYSIPVIYDHFKNKEAIQYEFTRQGFSLLNACLQKEKERHPDPAGQLEAMAYAYWNFAFNHVAYYQLMYGLGMPTCETIRQTQELHAFSNLILTSIKALIAAGTHPKTDPMLKMHTFWSMMHGLISINMLYAEHAKDKLNMLVLKDFIAGLIISMK